MDDTTATTDFENLTISEDLVPCLPQKQSAAVTLDFKGLLDPPLVLQSNESQCGGQLWPAGLALAGYLLREKTAMLMGKTILELGAGTGLVSLAIALRLRATGFSNNIHITDGLNVLLPLVQQNISINEPNIRTTTKVLASKLSWGQPLPDGIPHEPDILLAADCCYIEESFLPLLKTMEELIGEETVCYFCFKKRRRADKEMIRMLTKAFNVTEIGGEWQREGMFIHEITMKKRKMH